MTGLKKLGGDVEQALHRVRVPAYVIDRHGIIRWLNPAAKRIVGDAVGRQMTSVLAPEERRRGREIFTRNLMGPPEGSDNRGVFLGADGERIEMEVSGVLLEKGHSTEQIATELHLSVETVRNHIRGILRNLGVRSRLEAVALAHQ